MLRLESATTTLPAGDRIQDLRYDYDPIGNLTTMQSLLPDPGPGAKLPGGGAWSFSYDGVNRLLQASGNNALAPNKLTTFQQTFEYSPSHNLLHKKRDHALYTFGGSDIHPPHTNIDYAYEFGGRPHAPTRVGDLDLTYDPSGNVIAQQKVGTGAVSLLEWDDDGRMVQYQRMGAFQRNYYDASGRRVLKLSRLGETHYVSRTFEVRNGEMATKHIFAGGTRVASVRSHYQPATQSNGNSGNNPGHGGPPPGQGGTPPGQQDPGTALDPRAEPGLLEAPGTPFYFHVDHLGSTSVLTTEDGELHEHLRFFPDGEVWIEKGPRKPINGYQFSGKPYDPETGFADFGMRFYDPSMSLWLSVDPALVDGPGAAVGSPMALSPYAYAAQSPMVFVDPDGREDRPANYLPDAATLKKAYHGATSAQQQAILEALQGEAAEYSDYNITTLGTAINSLDATFVNWNPRKAASDQSKSVKDAAGLLTTAGPIADRVLADPRIVVGELAEQKPQIFGDRKCVECAKEIESALNDAGLSGKRYRMTSAGGIGRDGVNDGKRIEDTGVHEWVVSDGVAFDNWSSEGLSEEAYKGSLVTTSSEYKIEVVSEF